MRATQQLGGAPRVQEGNWRQLKATEPGLLHGGGKQCWIVAGLQRWLQVGRICNASCIQDAGWCDAGHSRTQGC